MRVSVLDAAEAGDEHAVRAALREGAFVNAADPMGNTPLLLACAEGHAPVVLLLLQMGADVQACNVWGDSPLHVAAEKGQLSVVAALLGTRVDVDAVNEEGQTALHKASGAGHAHVAHLLINAHVDPNVFDMNGDSALMVAARSGHTACLEAILVHAPKRRINHRNNSGATALALAARRGHALCVRALLRSGGKRLRLNTPDANGHTALLLAVQRKHTDVVVDLLAAGADVHTPPTLVHVACRAATDSPELLALVLRAGANPNVPHPQHGSNMPLHTCASLHGHVPHGRVLLRFGARAAARNDSDETPLDVARAHLPQSQADEWARMLEEEPQEAEPHGEVKKGIMKSGGGRGIAGAATANKLKKRVVVVAPGEERVEEDEEEEERVQRREAPVPRRRVAVWRLGVVCAFTAFVAWRVAQDMVARRLPVTTPSMAIFFTIVTFVALACVADLGERVSSSV